MKCCICEKVLEEVLDHTKNQPYAGGEIKLAFTYGSTKFDNSTGMTFFDGFICDDCAEKIIPNLKESHTHL